MKRQEEERQRDYTRRTFYLNDFAKEMRLTNIYKVMFARFNRSVKNIIAYIKEYGFKLGAVDYITEELYEVGAIMGAQLYSVYRTLVSGTMKYGDCLFVLAAISEVSNTLMNGTQSFFAFHENSLYIDTIREYLEYEPKIKDGEFPAPKSGDIKLENVCFRYAGQNADVLKNVNIEIHKGEKIAIVGYNGAGKTTLIKLLLRLYDPTEGEVKLNGENLCEYETESYREKTGAVFQDYQIFAASIAENVAVDIYDPANPANKEKVLKALHLSTFDGKLESLEKGIDTPLTREFSNEGVNLSGGEAQKVAIARVFYRDCELIIMDEPSSALDPMAEYELNQTILNYAHDKTVIFISHRLSTTRMADRIYMFAGGCLIENGSHDELMKMKGEYAAMFELQAEKYKNNQSEF